MTRGVCMYDYVTYEKKNLVLGVNRSSRIFGMRRMRLGW